MEGGGSDGGERTMRAGVLIKVQISISRAGEERWCSPLNSEWLAGLSKNCARDGEDGTMGRKDEW